MKEDLLDFYKDLKSLMEKHSIDIFCDNQKGVFGVIGFQKGLGYVELTNRCHLTGYDVERLIYNLEERMDGAQ